MYCHVVVAMDASASLVVHVSVIFVVVWIVSCSCTRNVRFVEWISFQDGNCVVKSCPRNRKRKSSSDGVRACRLGHFSELFSFCNSVVHCTTSQRSSIHACLRRQPFSTGNESDKMKSSLYILFQTSNFFK